jgi:hypothetical protein
MCAMFSRTSTALIAMNGPAWSRMGERYQARAAEEERTDREAASDSYLLAFRYFAFGGWPT